jgi:hypothetical protein
MATTAQATAVAELSAALRGDVIGPDDARYDETRAVYNAMIDRRPAAIARCVDVADVIACVEHARRHGLRIAVRGGGHNGAGLGTCDDGLVIVLSRMNGVDVDPAGRVVRAQGGATFGDVDHATHAFGMATPGGIISTTGMGLTLGGGIGHLTRRCGLTIDNLVSADVVLADGSFVTASATENEDLFWAIRGGGGNFGVVTSLSFRLHPIGTVIFGPTLWHLDRAAEIMRFYREFLPQAPRELNGFFAFLTVPPGDPFPEHLHMQKMCAIVWCWSGLADRADEALAPVRALEPALDGIGPAPHPAMQSAFDAIFPPGDQWYWRADFVDELPDDAIARHVEFAHRLPTWKSTMHLYPIDGAVHDVATGDTAFPNRASRWAQVIVGVDPDPANAATIRSWCVDYFDALHPFATGGAYVNFMMDEGQERVRATYGPNYDRLARVKATYDPENTFRVNQNIAPAG